MSSCNVDCDDGYGGVENIFITIIRMERISVTEVNDMSFIDLDGVTKQQAYRKISFVSMVIGYRYLLSRGWSGQ